MKTLLILVVILFLVAMAAIFVISLGLSWVHNHFEEEEEYYHHGQEADGTLWTVHTDDFRTVEHCLMTGSLRSVKLVWSWRKLTWLFRFTYAQ